VRLTVYALKRIALIPISMLVLATASFLLVSLIPGDPGVTILGSYATPSSVAQIDHQLGVDQSLLPRYWHFLTQLAHGNLGTSFYTNQSVTSQLWSYLPNTIELVVASLILAALIGIVIGVVGAYWRRGWPDRATRGITTVLQAVPDFVLGLMLIYFVFFRLHIAPAPTGRLPVTAVAPVPVTHFLLIDSVLDGDWGTLGQLLEYMVLPVVTLGVIYSAYFAKTVRGAMGDALRSNQVDFARACGLPEWRVVLYALLQGRTTLLTYGAILFGSLIGGEAIVETVFSWPGAGRWALQSMLKTDVPVIEGFILATGLATLVVYVVLDVVVAALDPRITKG
jgi:ABC-type dipeptide/oligopeptide/nickel transport system permease component